MLLNLICYYVENSNLNCLVVIYVYGKDIS